VIASPDAEREPTCRLASLTYQPLIGAGTTVRTMVGQGEGRFGPGPHDWTPPVPLAIFLDTSIVIDLETYGDTLWDGAPVPPTLPDQHRRQLEALKLLLPLADRAGLAFAVSPEVVREAPGSYVDMIAGHWREAREAWGFEDRGLPPMTLVVKLPEKDQLIIAQAYRSGCEVVLTNDLRWLSATHRRTIAALGMEAHTPETLIDALHPWLALWL
jgi:hypothetical protein